jgi:hypothetical protein
MDNTNTPELTEACRAALIDATDGLAFELTWSGGWRVLDEDSEEIACGYFHLGAMVAM